MYLNKYLIHSNIFNNSIYLFTEEGDAEKLSDFKVYTVQKDTNFNIETENIQNADLVEYVPGYLTSKAIIDVYPIFYQSKYSEYILIHKQSTKNAFTSKHGFGNIAVREVMAEGFIPCS